MPRPEAAVDTVVEAISHSLAREEAVRIAGFGTFATREPGGAYRKKSANRGGGCDTVLEGAGVQGGQGVEGQGEARRGTGCQGS